MKTLLFLALAPFGTAQEPIVTDVRMRVDVQEEAPDRVVAQVALEYGLILDPSVTRLPIRAMRFAGILADDVTATVGTAAAPVIVESIRSDLLEGSVELPRRDTSDLRLRLTYRVIEPLNDDAYRMTVPLLLPAGAPAGAPDDFFLLVLRVPEHHVIVEAFPTLPPARPGEGVRDFRLQVVPAMVRWRATLGQPPLLRFGRIIDLSAILVLLVTGALTLRVLGREPRP